MFARRLETRQQPSPGRTVGQSVERSFDATVRRLMRLYAHGAIDTVRLYAHSLVMRLTERLEQRYLVDGDTLARDALLCLKAAERVLTDLLAHPERKASQKRAADLLKKLRT